MGQFISWLNKNVPQGQAESNTAGAKSVSAWGMVDTLVPVLALSAVYLAIFLIMRRSQRRYYAPRTYLGSMREYERTPSLPKGYFNWFRPFWRLPDTYALQHQGLDAYLFLRYLRVCCIISFGSLCITWPILFPINATGGGGQSQLDAISYSNVDIKKNKNYLYAQNFVGWVVFSFVIYMIVRECIFYINLRQAFLLTPQYAKRISSRTVLFTAVPSDYLDAARLRAIFTDSVKNVWIAGDTTDLDAMVENRDKTAMKLEEAEISLLKTVNKERIKALKKSGAPPADDRANVDKTESPHDAEAGDIAARWIAPKQRPHHRLGKFGLVGKKVDTIDWGRSELQKLVPEVEAAQSKYKEGEYKKLSSVFIEFHHQSDAQAAYQVLTHHQALQMSPKFIGVQPNEVIWKNLNLPWWQKILRTYAVNAFITCLIVFWAIPVGIVGVISKVSTLENIPGLTWIKDIPKPILGVISGLLPSVALSILMSLVPVIMRACAKKAGAVSLSEVELFTQNAYFVFQVIQVFLIRTITDSAAGAIVEIAQKPSDVFSLLSQALPASSNFYISYFIVQGLSIGVSVLTQVVGLVVFRLLYKFLAKTPRAMYTKWTNLSAILWGSVMPVYAGIAVISVTYSIIAPFMLFWSSLALFLFWLGYRYNILFVTDTTIDTHGLIYPRAIKQLFTGVYLGEICMVGLFAVSKAAGPAALMAIFLIATILFQITLNNALNPLLYRLPRSLEIEEEIIQARKAATNGSTPAEGEPASNDSNGKSNGLKTSLAGNGDGIERKGNLLMKFLKPWIYADYHHLREVAPDEEHVGIVSQYTEEIESHAYWPPSVKDKVPVLWIPEDPLGLSKQEVAETSKVIPISDEGATLNEENKIIWDTEGARPPIWSEKIYY